MLSSKDKEHTRIKEIIHVGQLELHFLLDGDDTEGRLCLFEFVVPPQARVPAPHFHTKVDELLYGLRGTMHGTVAGQAMTLGPGESYFIGRGVVHHWHNPGPDPAHVLTTLTPASIGPAYFRELGALLAAGPPDPARVRDIMARHGLVVA